LAIQILQQTGRAPYLYASDNKDIREKDEACRGNEEVKAGILSVKLLVGASFADRSNIYPVESSPIEGKDENAKVQINTFWHKHCSNNS
jgi:hypothetical protein